MLCELQLYVESCRRAHDGPWDEANAMEAKIKSERTENE